MNINTTLVYVAYLQAQVNGPSPGLGQTCNENNFTIFKTLCVSLGLTTLKEIDKEI